MILRTLQTSLALASAIAALLLSACQHTGWRCMAQPTLGPDAKQIARIYGFELRCAKKF